MFLYKMIPKFGTRNSSNPSLSFAMALYGWKINIAVAIAYAREHLELIRELLLRDAGNNPQYAESYVQTIREMSMNDDDESLYDMIVCVPLGFCHGFFFEIIPDAGSSGHYYFGYKLEMEFTPAKTRNLFGIPFSREYHTLQTLALSLGALTSDAALKLFCQLD